MSITEESELIGMRKVSDAVASALKEMKNYVKPGMTSKELDDFGASVLKDFGASSAPNKAYKFPGWTCISIGKEFCHGVPNHDKVIKEGDLINIDVSAELDGFWSDNGESFVVGEDRNGHQRLVDASRFILKKAVSSIKAGVRISDIGHLMETEAARRGFKVVKNLAGHGVGRFLHEEPSGIVNYRDSRNREKFRKNSVVAIETFISTNSSFAVTLKDGWTMVGDRGGYMAQHEHTIAVTEDSPIILTEKNGI